MDDSCIAGAPYAQLPEFSLASPRANRILSAEHMIALEGYAAGVRQLEKILELDHELEGIPGLRYKADSNHDLVYMEFEEPTLHLRKIRAIFRKLNLEPRFLGTIPAELRSKPKTQLLSS